MLRRKLVFAIGISALAASHVLGNCALKAYRFRGVVRVSCKEKVVTGARIVFFLDDQDVTLDGGSDNRFADHFTSDRLGRFRATSYFDTFASYASGSGHVCDREAKTVEVFVTKAGYRSRRARFELKVLASAQEAGVVVYEIPALELEPSAKKES
jgi:hypothetical protein